MDNPLVNLKSLSKPITKLIEVLADGIGTLYAPFCTVRNAKADAKAMIIRAEAGSEVASLQARVDARLVHRESVWQENLEAIAATAANALPEHVSDEPVDRDWLSQFINRVQDISNEDMQQVWGKILAGEVTVPGKICKENPPVA